MLAKKIMMKRRTLILGLGCCALLTAFATTILPRQIEGVKGKGSETSHPQVKCDLHRCGDPNLIQCYLVIEHPLTKDLFVHMTIEKDGKPLVSAPLDGYWKDKKQKAKVFNFALATNFVAHTYVEIFSHDEFLQLNFKTVDITDGQPKPEGDGKPAP